VVVVTGYSMKIAGWVLLAGAVLLLVLLPVKLSDWRGPGVDAQCGRALFPKEFPTLSALDMNTVYDVPIRDPFVRQECRERAGDRFMYGFALAVVGGVVLAMGIQREKREWAERDA